MTRTRPVSIGSGTTQEGVRCIRLFAAIFAVSHALSLSSTSYCQGSVTASGRAPFVGEVANNLWPLGTRISVSPPVWGRTQFIVLDRIGWGSSSTFTTTPVLLLTSSAGA